MGDAVRLVAASAATRGGRYGGGGATRRYIPGISDAGSSRTTAVTGK